MRKFLKLTAIFLLPILMMGITAELLLRHIPNDYVLKNNYLQKHGDEITVLFLGSSHAFFGVNPDYVKEKSFNAAYVSQTLDLDVDILEKYNEKWEKLKFIVIPVSYFSLYGSLAHNMEKWRLKNYEIYYGIKMTRNPFSGFEMFGKFEPNVYKLYSYYVKKDNFITSTVLGWGPHMKLMTKSDLLKTGISAAKRQTGVDDEYLMKNKAVLKHIIDFAQQRHIKVLFYTPPAYKTYSEHLNSRQLKQTTQLMENLAAQFNHVTYVNFLKNDTFVAADFYDADHLNVSGAKKFSVMLDGLIQNIKSTGSKHAQTFLSVH